MKKKTSLSVKLTVIMIILVAGIIALCWFLNHSFLEDFYIYEKQQTLLESYEVLNNASKEGILAADAFDITFENLCANGNLSVLVIDHQMQTIRSSVWDFSMFIEQVQELLRYGVNPPFSQSVTLVSTEEYVIMRQTDTRLKSDYLVFFGNLVDGGYVYAKTPLESIRESAAITNRFFIVTGLFGMAAGVVAILFLAGSVSRPMKELTEISKSMSDLRFEVKYEPKKQDSREIAELGAHMNFMSRTLEKTISDLKAANNELKQDIAKKEQMDEMRKEFLSNVSHELKTPIALIQGYAEGLKEEINENPESREYYCDVIIDESGKMNNMVKKLLTLNQLEFGNDVIEMTRFNISEMIAGLVQANRILAEQNGISISFQETEPAFVWGDEFKVEEVLTNYLSNAIHHAAGEKEIQIYYENKEEVLRICVYNSGSSIPEEELEKIWDKFYKVDKARTREYGGSGIGLSIVKAIMESMHRNYGVYNKKNGIEFWFELENSCINN